MRTDVAVDDAICSMGNGILSGCYKCAKGATAAVTCASSRVTQAQVVCDTTSFAVDCDQEGRSIVLRFNFDRARIYQKFTISCGRVASHFEISGILKFTHSVESFANKWLSGTPNSESDIHLPDFWHITDVFLQWYKTLIAAIIGLLLLAVTYEVISTCGLRITAWIIRCIFWTLTLPIRFFFRISCQIFRKNTYRRHGKYI